MPAVEWADLEWAHARCALQHAFLDSPACNLRLQRALLVHSQGPSMGALQHAQHLRKQLAGAEQEAEQLRLEQDSLQQRLHHVQEAAAARQEELHALQVSGGLAYAPLLLMYCCLGWPHLHRCLHL